MSARVGLQTDRLKHTVAGLILLLFANQAHTTPTPVVGAPQSELCTEGMVAQDEWEERMEALEPLVGETVVLIGQLVSDMGNRCFELGLIEPQELYRDVLIEVDPSHALSPLLQPFWDMPHEERWDYWVHHETLHLPPVLLRGEIIGVGSDCVGQSILPEVRVDEIITFTNDEGRGLDNEELTAYATDEASSSPDEARAAFREQGLRALNGEIIEATFELYRDPYGDGSFHLNTRGIGSLDLDYADGVERPTRAQVTELLFAEQGYESAEDVPEDALEDIEDEAEEAINELIVTGRLTGEISFEVGPGYLHARPEFLVETVTLDR